MHFVCRQWLLWSLAVFRWLQHDCLCSGAPLAVAWLSLSAGCSLVVSIAVFRWLQHDCLCSGAPLAAAWLSLSAGCSLVVSSGIPLAATWLSLAAFRWWMQGLSSLGTHLHGNVV